MRDLFTAKENHNIETETLNILRIIRSENIGPKTFHNIVKYFGSPSEALAHLPEFIQRSGSTKKITLCPKDLALKEIELMEKEGAQYVTYLNPQYSNLLQHISDFPPILSYKGNLQLMNNNTVSIVGARNCSIAGKQFTKKLVKELSSYNIVIVSGLARGIDTEAHTHATPNTIAVIAGGIDNIYPPENHRLYQEIAKDGLILAELPINSVPLARHFPQRNRIISGLSRATAVIEANISSGSLITANFALEQNREVFACPGFPLDARHSGTNKLIKEGAYLLESSSDIMNIIEAQVALSDTKSHSTSLPIYSSINENDLNDANRKLVLSCLSASPCSLDEIYIELQLPLPIIITILLELELQAKIVYHPGNKFSLDFRNI